MNGKLTYTCYVALEVSFSHFGSFSLSPRSDGKLLQGRSHLETIKNNFNYFFIPVELTQTLACHWLYAIVLAECPR